MTFRFLSLLIAVSLFACGCATSDVSGRCMDFCDKMYDCNREFDSNQCHANCLLEEKKELVAWLIDCLEISDCNEFLHCVNEGEPKEEDE